MKSPKKTKKTVFLEEVHIKNFLSLRDIVLPLKPLTVLVGPNASGKTSILKALNLLMQMLHADELPPSDLIQEVLWAGTAKTITFKLKVKIDEIPSIYELELKTTANVNLERLMIDSREVISVKMGKGVVRDENGKNTTLYRPIKPKLALKSVADYGEKPITSALIEFIRDWQIYDFDPDMMRDEEEEFKMYKRLSKQPKLHSTGVGLKNIIRYWFEKDKRRFQSVDETFENSIIKRKIEYHPDKGDDKLYLWEGCEKPISLEFASDGTMRLLAYQVLLNHPEIPSLIAIEEPERNFHPAALKEIAAILEQLADRTQVIITTHSSQLLDAFNPENLSSGKMGVLMLQNIPGKGTQIKNLEEIRKDREALDGWIADFGIGSAIFDSELLQDITESQSCQA